VGIGFGPVIVLGSYFVQSQSFSAAALLASIPVWILIALILYANEIPDKPYDKAAGKKTIVVRLSDDNVLTLYRVLVIATYSIIVVAILAGQAPVTTLLALATIPTAIKTYRLIRESYGDPYRMIPGLANNIKLATLTGLLLGAGYALGAVVNWVTS
jgi:1,4-dihydroxy-2-naphthoate octaprenyltransferase